MSHHVRKYLNSKLPGKYTFVIVRDMIFFQPGKQLLITWFVYEHLFKLMKRELRVYYNMHLVETRNIQFYEGEKHGRRPTKDIERLFQEESSNGKISHLRNSRLHPDQDTA
jgi:hypothetical protein